MGIADRHYMRDPYNPPRVTTILIVMLIVAFVIQSLLLVYGGFDSFKHLGLTVAGLKDWKLWQLITFQFMHSAPWPWHVLINCLGLYFVGRRVEEILGGKRFIAIYLLSGLVGGLLQVATVLLPKHADIPVVGASAGICGLVAIFCSWHPMQELTTWFYFLPITIRARYLLMFLTGLSIFGTIVPFDYVAHAAHLGGILVGVGYVRWGEQLRSRLSNLHPLKSRERKRQLVRAASLRSEAWKRPAVGKSSELTDDEFISREVDPILEKISKHGIQSLTDRERKVLEAARKKISKP